jgi:hypothetical protein
LERNPYTPPSVPLTDSPPPPIALAAPRGVLLACRLIWLSLVMNVFALTRSILRNPGVLSIPAVVVNAFVAVAVLTLLAHWFTRKLLARRNWMRVLYTILNLGGVVIVALTWGSNVAYYKRILVDALAWVIVVAQWVFPLVAVGLINDPSIKTWFLRRGRDASGSA